MHIIDGCWDYLKTLVPPDQATYNLGRSNAEQAFIIEFWLKKQEHQQTTSFLLKLDISKAFDSFKIFKKHNVLPGRKAVKSQNVHGEHSYWYTCT